MTDSDHRPWFRRLVDRLRGPGDPEPADRGPVRAILEAPRHGWTPLMQAVEDGDVEVARRLLAEGAEPDAIAEDALTALAIACRDGHEVLVDMLLSAGADPDTRGIDDTTALTLATRRGNERIVERLRSAGASLTWDRHHDTAMSTAISAGQHGVLARLMQLQLPAREPQSAFAHACALGDLTAVRQLWARFRDQLTLAGDRNTPLMRAAASDNPALVDFLLDAGAPIDEYDLKDDFSPLMHAVMAGARHSARTLIRRGANVNEETEWFVTPLSIARRRRDRAMFDLLVEAGARDGEDEDEDENKAPEFDADDREFGPVALPWATYSSALPASAAKDSPPALLRAVWADDGVALALLLAIGEDPFKRPRRDAPSPFEEAFASGRGRFVRAMLAAQPDRAPEMDDEWVQRAISQPDPWILKMVLERGTTTELPELLTNAAVMDRNHHLALLLDRIDDPAQLGPQLLAAARYGVVRSVKLLLDRGAPIEARDQQSNTALHHAADDHRVDLVALLLDRGADIEARGWVDKTPLWCAIGPTHTRNASLLLARGANVHARCLGSTLLHHAARCEWTDCVALLLAHGADVNARDDEGRTPLDVACGGCVQLLS